MQRVKLVCPHCGAEETLLAAATKRGMSHACPTCGRTYQVENMQPLIGSASSAPKPRKKR